MHLCAEVVAYLLKRTPPATVILLFVLLASGASFAQVGGVTAGLRGTVEDPSGAVVPGAAVTLTNLATTDARTTATDDRGEFTVIGLFPTTMSDLSVERRPGSKTFHQTGIVLGPNDVRGLVIRLELGAPSETVIVRTPADIVQTETGAREGRLSAAQIDNLSIIGRSSLELLRILPGVVAPDQHQLESVSFIGGANDTQSYSINGIRTTNNAVSLDGSNLIDFGSNSGVMINVNNDMVQEVKVQSSNFNAEYGVGRGQHQCRDKGRKLGVPRDRLNPGRARSPADGERPLEQHSWRRQAEKRVLLPWREYRRARAAAIDQYTTTHATSCSSGSVSNRNDRKSIRAALSRRPSAKQRGTGDLSEFLANRGQNLNHSAVVLIPAGFPHAGTPAPNNDLRPLRGSSGPCDGQSRSARRHSFRSRRARPTTDSALEPTDRVEIKRGWTGTSARARSEPANRARQRGHREPARHLVERPGPTADARRAQQSRPLVCGEHRSGAEPVTHQRGACDLQPSHVGRRIPRSICFSQKHARGGFRRLLSGLESRCATPPAMYSQTGGQARDFIATNDGESTRTTTNCSSLTS